MVLASYAASQVGYNVLSLSRVETAECAGSLVRSLPPPNQLVSGAIAFALYLLKDQTVHRRIKKTVEPNIAELFLRYFVWVKRCHKRLQKRQDIPSPLNCEHNIEPHKV